jgi:hypothetical protein
LDGWGCGCFGLWLAVPGLQVDCNGLAGPEIGGPCFVWAGPPRARGLCRKGPQRGWAWGCSASSSAAPRLRPDPKGGFRCSGRRPRPPGTSPGVGAERRARPRRAPPRPPPLAPRPSPPLARRTRPRPEGVALFGAVDRDLGGSRRARGGGSPWEEGRRVSACAGWGACPDSRAPARAAPAPASPAHLGDALPVRLVV